MNDQPLNGPDAPRGCPVAHGGENGGANGGASRGVDDLTRLYGPDAAIDPGAIYARLRKEHGAVAPILLEGDVPAWLVLGYRENRRVLDNPASSAGIRASGGTGRRVASTTRPR